jgi:hypothetical protein
MYRYRYQRGLSCLVGERAAKHLPKLGQILSIRGYRYQGRYGLNEAVMVKGTNGSARFTGTCWGYGGSGPHAVRDLLMILGISKDWAEIIAFKSFRWDDTGTDWKVEFQYGSLNYWVRTVGKTAFGRQVA